MVKDDWKALFARVKSALMRRGRSEHDADDLVQEAWVRLACYEREHEVECADAFLMRTALNLSIDSHRMQARHDDEVLTEETLVLDTRPSADAVLLAKERLARLSTGLGRLNPKTRDIFLAHRVDGLSYAEIARRENLTVSSIEKHIAKATLLTTAWMEGW
jgi:RNA polymerase sigma factor (sigma-70 family)